MEALRVKDTTNWLEFWYEALENPFGVVIAVSDVPKGIQRLYQARQKSGDEKLAGLSIRKSPLNPDSEVWLVHTTSRKVVAAEIERTDGQE